jgi:PQQ enzyme repeat
LAVHAAQPVLQRGYDAGVSGATLAETTLNTSNVSPSTFGLVFRLPVDDSVFAQPLYVPNVAIPNLGTHNVVYVATMSDTLYAFDADTGGSPLWSVNLASLVGAMPVQIANFVFAGNKNIVGRLGILSTPVIDPSSNVMYVVACTLESNTLAYRLHAVDITTGAEPFGPGVLISGSYAGSTFDARYQTQRVSLALSGNEVVFGFAALGLEYSGGYSGWVMAYDKNTLLQKGIFATAVAGTRGAGVWQSGRPPVVDSAGYVYVFTGNGYTGGYDGVSNFSESALKLDPANGLALIDWFTAGNWSALDGADLDITSSGPLLIPGTNLVVGGGKAGYLYVLDTQNLGKFNASDSQIVQKLHASADEIRGGPVYWQRSAANGGPLLYDWGASDWVKAYAFNGTTLATSPTTQGSGQQIWPGGILALSANGEQHGSGVLWATVAVSGDAQDNPPAPGELRAFDAENLSHELWNSTMSPSRDGFGNFGKFVPPLVANGKVYVATSSNQVAVYGLLTASFTLTASPSTQTVMVGNTASYTTSIAAVGGFGGAVTLSVGGLPPGAVGTFSPATVTGSGSSTLTVTTTSGTTPVGSSTLTITGTSGALTQTSGVTLSVSTAPPPSFTLTASPSTQTVMVGNTASYTTSIAAVGGFSGAVTLSVSGLPAGALGTFSPATVTGSGSSTLTVTTSNGTTPVGSSTLTITGTSGALKQTSGVALSVSAVLPPSFTLAASPSTRTVVAGNTTTYTTSIAAVGGFSGAVTLSVSGLPAGAVGTFSPATVTGSGSSTLTVTTASGTTPAGSSTLTITGTSGALTQTSGATLSVTGAAAIGIKFVGQGSAMASTEVAGVVAQSNWNNATGTSSTAPLVDQTGASSGATVTWSTNGIYKLPITDTAGNNRMMRGYLDAVGGITTATVAGLPANAGSYNVYVYADGDNASATRTGAYQISGTGITTTSVNLTDAANTNFSGTFAQANNSNGNYVMFTIPAATGFTITATPGASTDAFSRAPLNAIQIVPQTATTPSFALAVSPSTQTAVAGNTATYTTNIAAVGGFSGAVTLSVSGLPAGAVGTFSPATVTGSGSSTLTVTTASSATPAGSSTLTITGTSGALTQTSGVTLAVTGAAAIGIKFMGQGSAMASTEVAGVVAQSNWNNATGASSTAPLVLLNQTGASAGATVTWSTSGIYKLPITDTAGNNRMMRGYLDAAGGTTTTVTIAGLPANAGGYSVYVYADGDNANATRTGAYQISGTGITTTSVNLTDSANTNFSGTFTQGSNSNGNYVMFTITAAAAGFTITAIPGASTDAFSRAPLNAIQIVPQAATTPGFALAASPSTQTAVAGNTATYTTNIAAAGGFSGAVTLSVSGLPAGAVGTFSPATVTGSGSSTLTVTTTSGTTPVGSSPLTITATSGALAQTAGVTLAVTGAAATGIKFVGQGSAMANTEVAGVVAQSNWNNAAGASSAAPLVLLDQTGASSGATVTWSTNGIYKLPITDTAGNIRMMRGYLDAVGGATTVTVAGLPVNAGGYSVYVYADGDNVSATRTGAYQISGTGITTTSVNLTDAANTNFSGTFTQGNNSNGNYVTFPITAAATGFTITATPGASTDAYSRAPLNAIQLVPN